MAFICQGIDALESAIMVELQASLGGPAEACIQLTAECDDENTLRALCMEVIPDIIENNRIF